MAPLAQPFLTAEWRTLAMLNYSVDPALLAGRVPAGTELDQFDGKTYISLVGFRFLQTRVRGLRVPFHTNFDEVNLRFYVRRKHAGTMRRGVVFIREIVPRWAIAKVARLAFNENYIALPMRHQTGGVGNGQGEDRPYAEYGWRHRGKWNSVRVECEAKPSLATEGSLEQFITEHYWGYAAQPDGRCLEYQVAHEPWRVWKATAARFEGEGSRLYGAELGGCLHHEPDSAFLAEGSAVTVYSGSALRAD